MIVLLPLAPDHMGDADLQFVTEHVEGIERFARVVLGFIEDDEADGGLRGVTVRCFHDMYDHIDVNQLDGDAGVPWGTDADAGKDGYEYVRAVQTRVDELLHSR